MAIGSPKVRGPRKPVSAGSVVQIKTLIKHPMESGLRKDSSGNPIPEHYIKTVKAVYDGNTVMTADWTAGVSANPFYAFYVKATKTGDVVVTWEDSKGQSFTGKATLKIA
ncbi:MAG: thiosulfate oxidation carrier complex protein SoxZ [Magnetococcales bacterium]|nr:thiosulfate oxidation carrier complex protein SoxZ [Magnetococcales bacterium]